jgi:hypothetical protein
MSITVLLNDDSEKNIVRLSNGYFIRSMFI